MTMDRSSDSFQHISNSVVHITTDANSAVVASWLTDKNGLIATFHGVPVQWPEVWGSVPVHTATFDGRFHVALSTRRVFVATSYVSLAFLLLGIAAYYCFRRLPLAALDDALEQLQSKQGELISQKQQVEVQNFRFDAALNNMSQGLSMFDGERRLVVSQRALCADVRHSRRAYRSRYAPDRHPAEPFRRHVATAPIRKSTCATWPS